MKYKALIFDTDGTILNTLPDITNALNKAFEECGYNYKFSPNECVGFIGSGSLMFLARAVKKVGLKKDDFDKLSPKFLLNYNKMQCETTKPYQGINSLLNELKNNGYMLFIASNKPHRFLLEVIDRNFEKDLFEDMIGQIPGNKLKPNPQILNILLRKYNLDNKECLYIGDSKIDIQTAKNAKMNIALVTYGYEEYTREVLAEADYVVSSVNELRNLLLNCKSID